jgi:phosphatidylinositol glycan class B
LQVADLSFQEWRERLRTSVHPFLFAAVFKSTNLLCNFLGANIHWRANALLAAPRVVQAFFAAAMDYYTWRVAAALHGSGRVANAALILTLVSPWQWFCSTRTFSNSLEATVTVLSLYLFPWKWFLAVDQQSGVKSAPARLYPALTGAAVAFYFRPTNILIWTSISAYLVWCTRSFAKSLLLVQAAAVVGTTVVVTFATADRVYYGEWACPPLRFLYINIVQSLAVFYGRNRVDYYFTEGLPLLLTTALPFAAYGTWQSLRHGSSDVTSPSVWQSKVKFIFAIAAAFTILTLSTIDHKEMRFLYPLLPMLHILAARPLASFSSALTRRKTRAVALFVLLATNIVIAYYTTMVHQRGVIDLMHYLRHKQEAALRESGADITIGFLMPCHSTPWRSHFVHPQIEAWALTCEPPLNMTPQERATYLDEADVFYADPILWLQQNMETSKGASSKVSISRRRWPQYLVMFEHLEATVLPLLKEKAYVEDKRLFNTHWHDDSRRKGDVVVLALDRP